MLKKPIYAYLCIWTKNLEIMQMFIFSIIKAGDAAGARSEIPVFDKPQKSTGRPAPQHFDLKNVLNDPRNAHPVP
jgi:hypothetical protein